MIPSKIKFAVCLSILIIILMLIFSWLCTWHRHDHGTCREQELLKSQLSQEDSNEVLNWQKGHNRFDGLHHVAGVDISFSKDNPDSACAMLAILSYPDLKVCNYALSTHKEAYIFLQMYISVAKPPVDETLPLCPIFDLVPTKLKTLERY